MPRPTDKPPDGDSQFLGVNQADPPGQLKPGEVADAVNARFRLGRNEPRLGPVKLPWTNKVTAGASSTPIPFGTIYGAGIFRDADDEQWGIIAADGGVYRTREGNGSAVVPLPPGITITSAVTFEQTTSGLVMFRGGVTTTNLPALRLRTLDAGFELMPQNSGAMDDQVPDDEVENPSDGTAPIPNADRGTFINGRLFIPYATATEKDLVAISDFSNATRYAPVRSQGRINQGSADKLIQILKFGKSEIAVCFKDNSIYELAGLTGSLDEMFQDEITKEYGLAAPKACLNVGKEDADAPDEVWFLANKRGICRITPDASTGRLGVQSIPVSREIQDIVSRINWSAIAGATFATWDNKFYAAVPLDDARVESPELLREQSYNSLGSFTQLVVPGATYRWAPGENDTNLTNGSEVLTDDSTFTAAGGSVVLTGTLNEDVTASLKRVFTNCNNAVLVYDFERGKWCGKDTGSAIQVKEWLKLRFGGEERLFYLGEDGFINCYEWLFDDQAAYETYGANLVSGGDETTPSFTPTTIAGRVYVYDLQIDSDTGTITNGSETITLPGSGAFVAQTTQVTVTMGAGGTWTKRILSLLGWTLEQEDILHDHTSRGYLNGQLGGKRGLWARLHFRSWFPEISVSEITEGVGEEIARLSDHTKSRTRYTRPHNRPDWDETNADDDHATPHREDYSLVLTNDTVASGEIEAGVTYFVESTDVASACSISYNAVTVNGGSTFVGVAGVATFSVLSGTPLVYPPGAYAYFDGNGIEPDRHQEWSHDLRLHSRGREHQLRLRTTQGRCELVAIELLTMDVDQRPGKRT